MSTTKKSNKYRNGHTVEIREDASGYFVASLDNGWVRVGLSGCGATDYPPEHPAHAVLAAGSADNAEELFDRYYRP
jgi:hypothetical protein